MLGPSIVPGNKVTVLENGDEIFPAMLEAIRGAQKTITFETYIWWSGKIAVEFSQALCERAKAGVEVNVTVDWAGSIKMDSSMLEEMQKCGVRIERYRPLHWYKPRPPEQPHAPQAAGGGRTRGLHTAAWVSAIRGWAMRRTGPLARPAFPHRGAGGLAGAGRVQRQLDQDTGHVLNGDTYFPEVPPAGEMRCPHVHRLAAAAARACT